MVPTPLGQRCKAAVEAKLHRATLFYTGHRVNLVGRKFDRYQGQKHTSTTWPWNFTSLPMLNPEFVFVRQAEEVGRTGNFFWYINYGNELRRRREDGGEEKKWLIFPPPCRTQLKICKSLDRSHIKTCAGHRLRKGKTKLLNVSPEKWLTRH